MINEKYIVRAKRIPHATDMRQGDFIEGYYAGTDNGIHFIKRGYEYIAVDPATLGQCTGLRDKNGKLIFEGDVVKTVSGEEEPEIYRVEWKNYRWELTNTVYDYPQELEEYTDDDTTLEIIGNIHDNPDLLEVTE